MVQKIKTIAFSFLKNTSDSFYFKIPELMNININKNSTRIDLTNSIFQLKGLYFIQ